MIVFGGDVMLGRLVNEALPYKFTRNIENLRDSCFVSCWMKSANISVPVDFKYPWGNAIQMIQQADLALFNLETAITSHPIQCPGKAFNFRMHPGNARVLVEAGINYVSLANNHILDFQVQGLRDTIDTLKFHGIAYAGAGINMNEARNPAILPFCKRKIAVFSFSDHGCGKADISTRLDLWTAGIEHQEGINLIDIDLFTYLTQYRDEMKTELIKLLKTPKLNGSAEFVIVSIHWGPNYAWMPSENLRAFAHFLIDECGVDMIHGHSAHHVQGIEKRNGKFIFYGCGDAVDDYAIDTEYRNNLSALYSIKFNLEEEKMKIEKVYLHPLRCANLQMNLLSENEEDFWWIARKVKHLSSKFGVNLNYLQSGSNLNQLEIIFE